MSAPFWLRRPGILLRGVLAKRDRPDLDALGRIADPEAFVWAILPHAARTFSACIALLPRRSALPAAVAYLYCRMLDTYEDLVPDAVTRDEALRRFAARLGEDGAGSAPPGAAPTISASSAQDARDRAHLTLVRRAHLVDRVYAALSPADRVLIHDLVRNMAEGMRWSSRTFASQGGALRDDEQLLRYCRVVLGGPVAFAVRLVRLDTQASSVLAGPDLEDAMQVGELIQLANVTRDMEKDLARGIAYDPTLRGDLGRSDLPLDAALQERVRCARDRILRLALARGPAYARMLAGMRLPRISLARASAVLMLLFTERYWRACATRCGRATWPGPSTTAALLARSLPALWSARRARATLARVESAFAAAGAAPARGAACGAQRTQEASDAPFHLPLPHARLEMSEPPRGRASERSRRP